MSTLSGTEVAVVCADATAFQADALVLKFAQDLYGADKAAFVRLTPSQRAVPLPAIGGHVIHQSRGALGARVVVFLGVPPLRGFGYGEIRDFTRRAIETVVDEVGDAQHVALTIHGPGYGLDEIEAFESGLAGVVDGVASSANRAIGRVTFVERNRGRAERLSAALARLLPRSRIPGSSAGGLQGLNETTRSTFRTVGYASAAKPRAFVAMSFAAEMDDVFHYGIQGASKAAGLLCERADLASFTGDVIAWVKDRISTARFLIADLSCANANVYLEVGYAWGKGVPTILLCNKGLAADLGFNVRGQRLIVYKSIKQLEDELSHELSTLVTPHS
ncbi:MAG: hypothetical protein H6934_03445 [Burkholderiaceae bacterium]|nr:hypothetical protein [Burkholderiaceae bacterium]